MFYSQFHLLIQVGLGGWDDTWDIYVSSFTPPHIILAHLHIPRGGWQYNMEDSELCKRHVHLLTELLLS